MVGNCSFKNKTHRPMNTKHTVAVAVYPAVNHSPTPSHDANDCHCHTPPLRAHHMCSNPVACNPLPPNPNQTISQARPGDRAVQRGDPAIKRIPTKLSQPKYPNQTISQAAGIVHQHVHQPQNSMHGANNTHKQCIPLTVSFQPLHIAMRPNRGLAKGAFAASLFC